jgi:hypothetical protein
MLANPIVSFPFSIILVFFYSAASVFRNLLPWRVNFAPNMACWLKWETWLVAVFPEQSVCLVDLRNSIPGQNLPARAIIFDNRQAHRPEYIGIQVINLNEVTGKVSLTDVERSFSESVSRLLKEKLALSNFFKEIKQYKDYYSSKHHG